MGESSPLDQEVGHLFNKRLNNKLGRRGQPPDLEVGPRLNRKLNETLNEKEARWEAQ